MEPHYLSQNTNPRDREYVFETFTVRDCSTSTVWNDFTVILW